MRSILQNCSFSNGKTTVVEVASHGQENDNLGGFLFHGTKGVADHLGRFLAWKKRRSRPSWGVLRMVSEMIVFWLLRMVPERSDILLLVS